jgi:hypothetical protein
MTVEVFVQCLKTIARNVKAFPHIDPVNPPVLSPEHIKHIVYKAMPTQWQVQFVRTHHGIALVTLLELQTFMSNEKTFADGIQLTTGKTIVNRNHPASHCQERRTMAQQAGRKITRTFDRGSTRHMAEDPTGQTMETTQYVARMEDTYGQIDRTIHKDKIINAPVIINTYGVGT